ncbi:MAG: AhpC/TSA family protein [Bacteroidales bacterium]|nr:AhpC/TSA family protein [Bacteroidales bacterium]
MKLKLPYTLAAAGLLALSASAEPFKVITPIDGNLDGAMARLVNFDTGETIDSVRVADHAATFTGDIDETTLARVMVDGGGRYPVFVLEPGTISFNKENAAFGTMLNDQARETNSRISAILAPYQAATPEQQKAIEAQFYATIDSAMVANMDNALSLFYFMNGRYQEADAAGLRQAFAQWPELAEFKRAQALLSAAELREATQEGKPFIDFEVTYNGVTKRLSDYVGRGHYTLVDFWASWCGPCLRQLPVLKDIYNKYKDDGLEVLGVAVWDEPEATKAAIAKHELPWECIINAQTIPADLYGIRGIPCIILFGPDGTIISRDKQGDELRAAVDAAMAKKE